MDLDKINALQSMCPTLCDSFEIAALLFLCVAVGHCWSGALQDHHHSVLQGSHGLHPHVWHHQWGLLQCCSRLVRDPWKLSGSTACCLTWTKSCISLAMDQISSINFHFLLQTWSEAPFFWPILLSSHTTFPYFCYQLLLNIPFCLRWQVHPDKDVLVGQCPGPLGGE